MTQILEESVEKIEHDRNKAKPKGKSLKFSKLKKALIKKESKDHFNNPLYAQLQSQEINTEQSNFGPWIHQSLQREKQRDSQVYLNLRIEPLIRNTSLPSIQEHAHNLIEEAEILREEENQPFSGPIFREMPSLNLKQKEKGMTDLKFSSIHLKSTLNRNQSTEKQIKIPKYKHSKCSLFASTRQIIDKSPSIYTENPQKNQGKVMYNYCYGEYNNGFITRRFSQPQLAGTLPEVQNKKKGLQKGEVNYQLYEELIRYRKSKQLREK